MKKLGMKDLLWAAVSALFVAGVVVLALSTSGCATQQSVLAPFTDLPEDCAGLAAEMLILGDEEALAQNVNLGTANFPTAFAYAAAAGVVPTGFAWGPTIATAISYYRKGSHANRLWALYYRSETRHCPTLKLPKKVQAAVSARPVSVFGE